MDLVIMQRDNPLCWILVPQVYARIYSFCEKYDSDAEPSLVAMAWRDRFSAGDQSITAVVALERGMAVGHLLIEAGNWLGARAINVIQYEIDKEANVPADLKEAGLAALDAMARAYGAKTITCLARNEGVARIFERWFGFTRTRIYMRRSVPHGGQQQQHPVHDP